MQKGNSRRIARGDEKWGISHWRNLRGHLLRPASFSSWSQVESFRCLIMPCAVPCLFSLGNRRGSLLRGSDVWRTQSGNRRVAGRLLCRRPLRFRSCSSNSSTLTSNTIEIQLHYLCNRPDATASLDNGGKLLIVEIQTLIQTQHNRSTPFVLLILTIPFFSVATFQFPTRHVEVTIRFICRRHCALHHWEWP